MIHFPRLVPALAGAAALASTLVSAGSLQTETSRIAPGDDACWVEVDTGDNLCADTVAHLADRMSAERHLEVAVRDSSTLPRDLRVDEAQSRTRATPRLTYLLVYIFDGANYGGKLKILTTMQGSQPCQLPQNYVYGQWSSLYFTGPIDPWNDRIRSFQTYNGCHAKLYDGEYFTGASLGPASGATNLGLLDRRASSMRIVK